VSFEKFNFNSYDQLTSQFGLSETIYLLHTLADQACKEEVMALASLILNGNLKSYQPNNLATK